MFVSFRAGAIERFQAKQVIAGRFDLERQVAVALILGLEIHRQGAFGGHVLVQLRRGKLPDLLFLDDKKVDRNILELAFLGRAG